MQYFLDISIGGLVGAVGDDILTMVGEDVLEKHKVQMIRTSLFWSIESYSEQGMLKDLVKKRFREKASVFLDLPEVVPFPPFMWSELMYN